MKKSNLKEFDAKRLFVQVTQLFITPEIKRRINDKSIARPIEIFAFQIVFHKRRPVHILLNEEVAAQFTAKLPPGTKPIKGKKYSLSTLGDIEKIVNKYDGDGDEAFMIAIKNKGRWVYVLDLRYDKKSANYFLASADHFIKAATFCRAVKLWRPFIENLWLSMELIVRAELILTPIFGLGKTHGYWTTSYHKWTSWGNGNKEQCRVYKELGNTTNEARYGQTFQLHHKKADRMLRVVNEAYDRVRNYSI